MSSTPKNIFSGSVVPEYPIRALCPYISLGLGPPIPNLPAPPSWIRHWTGGGVNGGIFGWRHRREIACPVSRRRSCYRQWNCRHVVSLIPARPTTLPQSLHQRSDADNCGVPRNSGMRNDIYRQTGNGKYITLRPRCRRWVTGHYRVKTLSEVERDTVTSNIHREFGEVQTCGYYYARRQTCRQTRLSQYFAHPPRGRVRSIVTACLLVCLSVCPLVELENHVAELYQIFMHVTWDSGWALLWRRCDILCTSGFVDDVLFSFHGANDQNKAQRYV